MPDTVYRRGLQIRREVLGDAHVDQALAAATDFDREFQEFITETAWGGAWARDGLDRRTRHLITLAMLAALSREQELAMHLRATPNTGVSLDELRELFFQLAIYAGIPAAHRAFAIAKQVLEPGKEDE